MRSIIGSLSYQQSNQLETFLNERIDVLPWAYINLLFRHLQCTLTTKSDLKRLIHQYGSPLYYYFFIALSIGVPWITETDIINLTTFTYPSLARHLLIASHTLHKYLWISSSTLTIHSEGSSYYTCMEDCLREGYDHCPTVVAPSHPNHLFLSVESVCPCHFFVPIPPLLECCVCERMADLYPNYRSTTLPLCNEMLCMSIEMVRPNGGYIPSAHGLTIERTGYTLDFDHIEYRVLNTGKLFYLQHQNPTIEEAFSHYFANLQP